MRVVIRLFASLRRGRKKQLEIDIVEGSTPETLIHQLQIKREHVSVLMINGQYASSDMILHEGDVISLLPAIGGG